QGLADGDLLADVDQVAEVAPLDELHDDEELAGLVVLVDRQDRDDVRVADRQPAPPLPHGQVDLLLVEGPLVAVDLDGDDLPGPDRRPRPDNHSDPPAPPTHPKEPSPMRRLLPALAVAATAALAAVPAASQVPTTAKTITWKKTVLDTKFRSEGVAVADVNKDGKIDVLNGEYWYEAPDWKPHELQPFKDHGTGLNN